MRMGDLARAGERERRAPGTIEPAIEGSVVLPYAPPEYSGEGGAGSDAGAGAGAGSNSRAVSRADARSASRLAGDGEGVVFDSDARLDPPRDAERGLELGLAGAFAAASRAPSRERPRGRPRSPSGFSARSLATLNLALSVTDAAAAYLSRSVASARRSEPTVTAPSGPRWMLANASRRSGLSSASRSSSFSARSTLGPLFSAAMFAATRCVAVVLGGASEVGAATDAPGAGAAGVSCHQNLDAPSPEVTGTSSLRWTEGRGT